MWVRRAVQLMTLSAAFGTAVAAGDLDQKKLDEVYALTFRVALDTPDTGDRETPCRAARRRPPRYAVAGTESGR